MFKSRDFDITDSKYLQAECEKQALEKYVNGNYDLGKLDKYGQRISIRNSIPRKDTGEKWFRTSPDGWYNKTAKLNTPYGGK